MNRLLIRGLKLLRAAVITYVLFVLLLFVFQRQFLYFPDTNRPDITTAPWAQEMTVMTSDELVLMGWWLPPATADSPVLIFFHGNGSNIENRIPKVQHYVRAGYGVLLASYRGYGGNPGKPSEQGLYRDGRAYMNWLYEIANILPSQTIIYGESLGSGVATQMATEYASAALVLDVPFNSAVDVAKWRFPYIPFMGHIVKDQYRSDEKIAEIDRPVLIGVGTADQVVPARFGKALYASATQPKTLKVYAGAGHMTLYNKGFAPDVMAFVEGLAIR